MQIPDSTAIQEVLAGNEQAFAVLMDRYSGKGMGLAMRLLRNREEAEEALQDAFVRAFRGLPTFQGTSSFGTWFYRILFNVCHSRLELRREIVHSLDGSDQVEEVDWISDDPLPDVLFTSNEFQRIITDEIEHLPEPFGSTFVLFAIQEMKYEEISEILSVPMGTIKARIFRARSMIRAGLVRRWGKELELPTEAEGARS